MSLPISTRAVAAAPASNPGERGPEEIAAARLALMNQLQSSLAGSQRALLALDLAGMREKTCEQEGLARDLQALLQRTAALSSPPGPWRRRFGSVLPKSGSGLPNALSELASELGQSEICVRQALRLHAALLRRAQQRLRIVTNTLAGRSVDYSSLMKKVASSNPVLDWNRGSRTA
jgi:hypothetical protein